MHYIIKTILETLTLNYFAEREMDNPPLEIFEPIDTISIIVPCFNEETFIRQTLQSIRGQSIIKEYSEYFEIILVNNNSTDNSVNIAEPYVDKIINVTKKGKLYARNQGIQESNGNIIVATDADIYYPPFWLNSLLEPFNNINIQTYDPNIVVVIGSTIDINPSLLEHLTHYISRKFIHPLRISGGNSAFWKHQFYNIGRFNENINQMDIKEILQEEEYGFGTKLSKFGKVIYKSNAKCIHLGGERIKCRHGTNSHYCKKQMIGIQRFG